MPATTSILILNSAARMSYNTLRQWLVEHEGEYRVDVLNQTHADALKGILASRSIQVVPRVPAGSPLWRGFLSAMGRYDTILVLCVADDQVAEGHAPYRLLGESLFSASLVLIGPHTTKVWSGGRILRPQRAREVAALAAAGIVSVITTTITLAAIVLYDIAHQTKIHR